MQQQQRKIVSIDYVVPLSANKDERILLATKLGPVDKISYADQTIALNPSHYYRKEKDWKQKIQVMLLDATDVVTIELDDSILEDADGNQIVIHMVLMLAISMPDIYKVIVSHKGHTKRKLVEDCIALVKRRHEAMLLSMVPGNVATPAALVQFFKEKLGKLKNTSCKVWDHKALHRQSFGLITAIGNSSSVHPPAMIAATRRGVAKNGKHICIVGKGVTFDSGGLAIKPFKHMRDQKFDKIGAIYAGYVFEHIVQDERLKDHTITCILPFAENVISDTAPRPGDVIKSYLGKTVEISNPDAEGRLLIADAFGYAHHIKPDLLIDVATLTGHAQRVSCWHSGYYYTENKMLKEAVETRSNDLGERMIPMPTWPDYDDVLSSTVADLLNSPEKCSDAFVAALFLKQFVPPSCDWLHIDLSHSVSRMIPTTKGMMTMIDAIHSWLESKK